MGTGRTITATTLGSPWRAATAVEDALAALERIREVAAVYEREYATLPAEVEQ